MKALEFQQKRISAYCLLLFFLFFNVNYVHADPLNKQLRQAAKQGNLHEVKSLIADGADIEARSKKGYTVLHVAVIKGKTQIVEYLIAKGANVNNVSNRGSTPLMSAAHRSYTEILQMLLTAGADPKPVSKRGNTALDLAIKNEDRTDVEILKLLDRAYAVNVNTPPSMQLSNEKFRLAARSALLARGWRISKEADQQLDAELKKGKRKYKVAIQKNDDHIAIRFLPFYGSHRLNYLNNLQKDIKAMLDR